MHGIREEHKDEDKDNAELCVLHLLSTTLTAWLEGPQYITQGLSSSTLTLPAAAGS